jgi:hypothetical protein
VVEIGGKSDRILAILKASISEEIQLRIFCQLNLATATLLLMAHFTFILLYAYY